MVSASRRFCLTAAVIACMASTASAQEWARFHGPNGTGESETELPASWSDSDYRWTVKLPGRGNSSPTLWGDRLFILSADPQTATRYVLCYHADTGEELWSREFPSTPHPIHKMSSFASSTPAADEERIYVGWSEPKSLTLIAFTHDGDIAWKKDLGPWLGQHGFGTSPMLFEDLLILSNTQELKDKDKDAKTGVPPHSYLMAFDKRTGEERWRLERKTDSVTYSVPAIFQPKDGPPQIVNTSTGSGLYAVDPHSGKELWSSVVFRMRTVSSPVIKGDLIFGSTGSGGGGNYVAAVRTDGTKAELAYQIGEQAPYVPTVVSRGDLLFLLGDAGVMTCIDVTTGKVHWRERIGGNYQGSPVRAADKIYCVSVDGEVVVLAASDQFEELGRIPLSEGSRSTPAIARGNLYIRTFSQLLAIGGEAPAASVKSE